MLKSHRAWALAITAVAAVMVVWSGRGGEAQFSPDTFESRGVSYFYVPLTDLAVLSLPGRPYLKKIVEFWIDEGYLPDPCKEPQRWDVITGWRAWQRYGYSGPAKLFWYRAGCRSDEAADEWIEWSRRHPAFAARVWPQVVGLLGRGRQSDYHLAAELMLLVVKTADPGQFEKALAAWRAEVEAAERELSSR
jgi:hypothetical protein